MPNSVRVWRLPRFQSDIMREIYSKRRMVKHDCAVAGFECKTQVIQHSNWRHVLLALCQYVIRAGALTIDSPESAAIPFIGRQATNAGFPRVQHHKAVRDTAPAGDRHWQKVHQ